MTISTESAAASSPAFTTPAFRRGLIAGLPLMVAYGVPAIVMGVAYKGAGFDFLPAVGFSLFCYASTAQAVTLGLWAMPPPFIALALASLTTYARYLVMGAHLHQYYGGFRKLMVMPMFFFLSDASWMMTAAEAERDGPDAGYLLGSGLPGWLGWVAGTAFGYLLPLQPSPPVIAATAILPTAFVITLLPRQWRGPQSVMPWLLSATGGLVAGHWLGAGWAMLAGGSAGTLYSLLRGNND